MKRTPTDEKSRSGFTFFRSFRDAIEMVDKKDQLVLYKAVADYALDGIEPDISTLGALGRLCWTAIGPSLKSGYTHYQNGSNGGAPKGNQNARKTTRKQPKNNQETTEPLLNENENEDENEDENEKRSIKTAKRTAFVAPEIEEVKGFFLTICGTETDAECFYDHFTANGWRAGRNPMKDWKAAARNWVRRKPDFTNVKTSSHEPKRTYEPLD